MPKKRSRYDWDAIGVEYVNSGRTLADIANEFDTTPGAISKKAKKLGWTREKPTLKKTRKKKPPKPKKKRGRPTKFLDSQEIIELLARRGFTDVEIAKCLHITEATLNNWKKQHPSFFESLNDWKQKADKDVERSLYERACGYSHPETKAQFINDKNGGRWEYAKMTKHYPPDSTAMIFWLKNRQAAEWRDKIDHAHSGNVTVEVTEFVESDCHKKNPDSE